MSMVVWVMMGIAIWHFAVFVPDRFWGGIVGAFLVAAVGAALFGFVVSGFTIPGQNDTEPVLRARGHPRRRAGPGRVVVLRLGHRGRAPARRAVGRSVWLGGHDGPCAWPRLDDRSLRRAAAAALQDALGLGPAAAAILVRRGYGEPAAAREFLAADTPHRPADLPGAAEACELVLRHVQAGSRILVFGDYDVDGVCSTAMMIRTLRALGADPAWQLPSRAEGYGLGLEAVERIARLRHRAAHHRGLRRHRRWPRWRGPRELGMDVLVTDHHRPGAELPDCPVVHPALGPDGLEGPAGELCAAGVVLKLSGALYAAAGGPRPAEQDLDLAGLATVCDMVPLRGENRRIARAGHGRAWPAPARRACGR